MTSSRLVSILIPAYKATYFEEALTSAMRQNHDEVEIIVCDDCPDDAIGEIVRRLAPLSRWPVHYWRNPQSLGEIANVTQCLHKAQGEYIKFLFDDDLIVPDCARIMVDVFETTPGLSIVSSRRRRIDEAGRWMSDIQATLLPFNRDVVLDGREVVAFQGLYTLNFIGEPSSVMCRRADLMALVPEGLYNVNGHEIHWVGDLAIYVKLLQHGHVAILERTLSYFRVSETQYSRAGRDTPAIAERYHDLFREQIAASGWLRPAAQTPFVQVADLSRPTQFKEMDLLGSFIGRHTPRSNDPVERWLQARELSALRRQQITRQLHDHQGGPRLLVVVSDLQDEQPALMQTLMSLGQDSLAQLRLQVVVLSAAASLPADDAAQGLFWLPADAANQGQVLNGVLERFEFDWLLRVEAGVEMTADGLWRVAHELLGAQGCRAVFADGLQRLANGALQLAPRPDFDLDLLLSLPQVMARHWLFAREAVQAVGGFAPEYADALDLDLILRLVEHGGMQGIGHVDEALLVSAAQAPRSNAQEREVLTRHLRNRGYAQCNLGEPVPGHYHVTYGHPAQPSVSILIPAGGPLPQLQRCVTSLIKHSSYANLELLLLDTAPGANDWLAQVQALADPKIQVLRHAQQREAAVINQVARTQVRGDYLLLMDPHCAVVGDQWLQALLNHGQRPEVGVVAAAQVDGRGHWLDEGDVPVTGVLRGIALDQERAVLAPGAMLLSRALFEAFDGLAQDVGLREAQQDLCARITASGRLAVRAVQATLMRDTE